VRISLFRIGNVSYNHLNSSHLQGMDVRLSTQALSVQHSSDSVTVNLCQTLNQPDSKAVVSALSARACVVTVPLGCLKAGSVSFSPELTAPKATAINRIGFGLYNKVVIRFQEADVFWDRKTLGFGLVSLSNLKGSSESVTSGQIDPVSEIWFPFFMNLIPSTGSFTLVGACHRPEMEMLCDTEITELAMRALAAFFSNSRLPSPVEVKVTRWNSDRFSQGSYSSLPAGAEPDLYRTLARPEGALFFAGEHTIAMYPQSIHGAILSGQDAARAVSKYLNRQIHVRPQANGSISGQSAVNSVSTASAQPSIDLVIPTTGPFTTTLAEVELAHDRSLSSLQLADELQLELSEWQNPPDDAFFEW
jgi:monoamine oxidase